MFSYQYPTPETNFPYYHCEDPDDFLNRSCEPTYNDYDDDYTPNVIPDDVNDDDDESVSTLTPLDNKFRYTTNETDQKFLRQHLTKEKIMKKHADIVKAQEDKHEESPVEETPVIDIRPTNPWANKDSDKAPTFSEIIEQQKTEEEDERKRILSLSSLPKRVNRSSRYETMSNHSSGSHVSSPPPPPVSTEKSRLCIYGKDCKNKKKCMRSHTFDEWQPNICRFNKRCKNNKCLYYHEGDDKTSYLSNIIDSTKDQMAFYSKNKTMYIKNYNIN